MMSPDATRQVEAAAGALAIGGVIAITDEDDPRRTVLAAASEALTPAGAALMRGRGDGAIALIAAATDVRALGSHERAAIDLADLAGMRPVALVCDVATPVANTLADGRVHTVSVQSVAGYRARALVQRLVETPLPTPFGTFTAVGYLSHDGREHVALVKGALEGLHDVPVEIHPQCAAGHTFRSSLCECRPRMEAALERLGRQERGVLIHLAGAATPSWQGWLDGEAACAVHRRRASRDPIALGIVADLAPAAIRPLLEGIAWPHPGENLELLLCA
jgi:hypothetical protein